MQRSDLRRGWVLVPAALILLLVAGAVTSHTLRPDRSPAPATREALAAVAVDVLDIEPTSYDPDLDLAYGVRVSWHPYDGGPLDEAHSVYLDIEPQEDTADLSCDNNEACALWRVGDGTVQLTWQDVIPESDPGLIKLIYATDGELRSLRYHGADITEDPRTSEDLPISVSELTEVITDDRFASVTTQEMVETELAKWPEGWEDDHDRVATTSKAVAHWMEGIGLRDRLGADTRPTVVPFSPLRYGEEAVGAAVRFDGWSVSLVIVPADGAPTCGKVWHCRTAPQYFVDRPWQVTTGWKRGHAVVIQHLKGRDVVAKIISPTIDRYPRPSPKLDTVREVVGATVESLEKDVGVPQWWWGLTTTKGTLDAYADREPFQDAEP